MTYSAVVMWVWVLALGATACGLVAAVRALIRVDTALAGLRGATDAMASVTAAHAALDRVTAEAARHRSHLDDRVTVEL